MALIERGNEDDIVFGTRDNDTILVNGGNDSVFAGDGNDRIEGGDGSDFLSGQSGVDVLTGASLNSDTLGRGEIDRLVGGDDNDVFRLGTRDGNIAKILYDDGDPTTNGDDDFAVIVDFSAADDDRVILGGDRDDYVVGPSPRALIASGDSIFLDTNKDGAFDNQDELIAVFQNINDLNLDSLSFDFQGGEVIDNPIDDDPNEPIRGTDDDDTLIGDGNRNVILGNGGNDLIKAKGGNDVLFGGAGRDRQLGGNGNDRLDGGAEKDIYVGGKGDDTFLVSATSGKDIIRDFQKGTNTILVQDAQALDFEDLTLVKKRKDTQVRLDDTTLAVLKKTKANSLSEADFQFDSFREVRSLQAPADDTIHSQITPNRTMAFLDTEPNDSPAQATFLGTVNGNLLVNGLLGNGSGRDTFDFYRFRVDKPSRFGATLFPTEGDANIMLTDRNNNLIDISTNRGTAFDTVESKVLLPGEYLIRVNKATTDEPNINYGFSMRADEVQGQDVTVTVLSASTNENTDLSPFFLQRLPDFYATVNIDGKEERSETRDDNRFPFLNSSFRVTQTVEPDQRFVPITLRLFDEDRGPDDIADINPDRGLRSLSLTLDTLTNRVSGTGIGSRQTGQTINTVGNPGTFNIKSFFSFRVDVNSSFSSFNRRTPITLGSRSSDFLRGRARGGILDGGKGNDEILGMGGDDALTGGKGRDDLNGGRGDDVLDGGQKGDRYTGEAGRDVFVIGPGMGVDVITDFQNGKDKIGLPFALSFEALEVKQRGKNTALGINGEKLAILKGIDADTINAKDFAVVDMVHFQGLDVPTLV